MTMTAQKQPDSGDRDIVLSTRDLTKHFQVGGGFLNGPPRTVRAVDGVSLDIRARETFALVGESGCGKTTLGRVMLRLQEPTSGQVQYRGTELTDLGEDAMRGLRKKLQIVFQDPYASLNPRMRVEEILAEPLRSHGFGSPADIRDRCAELLEMVGLRKQYLRNYPHQFSGGQRQRIGIARALANKPDFVVCDESVSALDVSIQAQVLNLLTDLQDQLKLTYFFITHDLAVVRQFADRVGVMFLGRLVEVGTTEEIFAQPLHPYSMLLMSAVPRPDPRQRGRDRPMMQGEIPSPMNLPKGCRFHTRCPFARDICRIEDPALQSRGDRAVACHFPLDG
ncbi:ATP-binding cassette domain-containing protein [Paracoccus sp. CPCC 101403]|uniref:ATP-binding cassette domain-containing protein n=1 Tax=Paracoccus broussonetiae TaxID=3075834 RepID=A0ABU3EB31_9RHOB|nr:oligopeptide/dipeptide ABC transporter ATP-binding protein [Paracoccus sp. CPCC 101403]MDT1061345.1 ATP-binding cassette domain-containing protein [Paracoccus sp. CPCC 101403]